MPSYLLLNFCRIPTTEARSEHKEEWLYHHLRVLLSTAVGELKYLMQLGYENDYRVPT